ncbi:PD-(D/E)XK nuclease family protein [Holospora curviuscula]|uniref:PD-(D/E)XK nuclease superfamily protein n=1 Tax=Holospora curviuscula TaxID=1082868 RepID=A0A2S5R819_9PROT|nr:PD-(D/E)XK nuclease family protein [Holospora curviuscula]PPE03474.1 PD-(D/E)XK nuclease superfamily protein [Holospora curviuscula]
MMSAKGENLFALTAHWVVLQSQRLGVPVSEWEVYVPYARCISFLQREFLTQAPLGTLPKVYPLIETHPISSETRLGLMLSFLTPVLPRLSLEHRISMAQDALELWEESLIYNTPWNKLNEIQEGIFSQYHGATLHVLRYISECWPDFVKKKNPTYNAYLEHILDRQKSLKGPTLLVGSQGTLPSTRKLMKQLNTWHQGWIMFPYGPNLKYPLCPSHPFYGFQTTLLELEVAYEELVIISRDSFMALSSRENWSRNALYLPDAQDAFLSSYEGTCLTHTPKNTFQYISVSTPLEEAHQVAECLIAYYKAGQSVLCVTPDSVLAQGVSTLLNHEEIPIKWQGSLSLIHHSSAHFILALWQCVQKKWPFFSTLDCVKHNVWRLRYPVLFQWICFLEDQYFRGNGLPENLLEWLKRHGQHTHYPGIAARIIEIYHIHLQPLSSMIESLQGYPLETWLQTLMRTLQGLLKDTLWQETGVEIKGALDALMHSSCAYEEMHGVDVEALLTHLFNTRTVSFSEHPCSVLHMCGPREARMLVPYYDVCIMTSLYEGGWPRPITSNPLLPPSLQESLNFPLSSWQIGLASRDFFACLVAPNIVMIRAKENGEASRFLSRLQAVLPRPISESFKSSFYSPVACSKPSILCSGVTPKVLSVSDMVLLNTNPYGFFLKRILGISPLPSFQQDVYRLGISCHRVLAHWMRRCPPTTSLPESVLRFHLMQLVEEMLFSQWDNRITQTQILRCFEGMFQYELKCRQHFFTSFLEIRGSQEVRTSFGPVTLVAQADRIDHRIEGGIIIDYKTGTLPKHIQENGTSTQVWWWAWLLQNGGFHSIRHASPKAVQWLHVSLSSGFRCLESEIDMTLSQNIQTQWEELEAYILGKKAYTPLESPNFTDGISRRLEWSTLTDIVI